MSLRQKAPLLLFALLLAAGGVLPAQEDRPEPRHESFDAGHVAEPHHEPAPSPPEPPPDTPSATPEAPADTPSESPSDTSTSGRYAVPVTEPVEPHRQPPSRDRRPPVEPPPSGGDDDGSTVPEEPYVESYEPDDDPSLSAGGSSSSGRPHGGRDRRDWQGALDLDVSPGRTQIYLDGEYLGIVDQYDGWPSYLLLTEGSYELVFYLDGYRTMARRVLIQPGMLIKMNDRLEPGPSIRPEDLVSEQPYERRTSGGRYRG